MGNFNMHYSCQKSNLFIIKFLLIKADILVVEQPFYNSDPKLFVIICMVINYHEKPIILSNILIEEIINLKPSFFNIFTRYYL